MARNTVVPCDDDASKAFHWHSMGVGGYGLEHHEIAAACVWYYVNYASKNKPQECWLWRPWRAGHYGR